MANAINANTVLAGFTVTATFSTKFPGTDTSTEQTLTFDYSDRDLSEIGEIATGALIVRRQAVYRKAATLDAMNAMIAASNGSTIMSKDAGKSPNGRAATPDQIAARLLELPADERNAYMITHMPTLAKALGLI